MTGLMARRILLAGCLVLTPALGLTQELRLAESASPPIFRFMLLPALIVLTIAMALVFGSLREKRKQELIARFIDKGHEIPPTLLPAPVAQRDSRRGVWLTSFALGLGLVLYIATGDLKVAVWCLIPLFLGAASFINAALFSANPDSRR